MPLRGSITFLLLIPVLAACQDRRDDGPVMVDRAAEEQVLLERSREWSATVGRGDMQEALDYWAEDAVVMPPGMPMLEGRDAIRAYVAEAGRIPGFRIRWEPIRAHIAESGDMAYMLERNEITVNDSTGAPVTSHGKVVTVWRKDEDGLWRNVIDIWNEAPAPQ